MRKLLLILWFFIFHLQTSLGQWTWAKQGNGHIAGGGDNYGLAVDNSGNAFITGDIAGSCVFGKDSLYTGNIYVVKYDKFGNEIWARSSTNSSAGGNQNFGGCITADLNGNVYVAGTFKDSVIFGTDTLIGSPFINIFVIKYDATGNVKWAINTHGSDTYTVTNTGNTMVSDKAGNIYITGEFVDTLYLNKTSYLYSDIHTDVFLVKYNPSGNLIWARQATGFGYSANGLGLAVDDSAHIYMTANCSGAHTFGTWSIPNARGTVIVKYDSAGNALWAVAPKTGITALPFSNSIASDGQDAYILGRFNDTLYIASDTLVAPSGKVDLFVAKYSSAGKPLWAKQSKILDTNKAWEAYTIAVDSLKKIYITAGIDEGLNTSKIVFDKDTFGLVNEYDGALFIQADSSFNVLCGSMLASGGEDMNSVAANHGGKYIYFATDFADPTVIGSDTLGPPPAVSEYPVVGRWQSCSLAESVNEIQKNLTTATIYPNPSTGAFTIQSSVLSGKSSVEIYNMLGQEIHSEKLTATNTRIDLNNSSPGIYLYRVITETSNLVSEGKFIIQK